jgi:hypothetical protein
MSLAPGSSVPGSHLAAYWQSVNGNSLTELNIIQDDVLTKASASRFLVPTDFNAVYAMAALGNGITRAQLDSPSLQVRRESMEVIPRVAGAAKFTLGFPEVDILNSDLVLAPTETIAMKTSDAKTAAFSQYGGVFMKKPGPLPAIPTGDIRRVRSTATTTLVQGLWTTFTPTLDNSLEPGSYALAGILPISANGIFGRTIITGQAYRPGNIALPGTEALAVDAEYSLIKQLMFYNMGQFTHINVPQIQMLADSGDTSETVFYYVVKTGSPPVSAGP